MMRGRGDALAARARASGLTFLKEASIAEARNTISGTG